MDSESNPVYSKIESSLLGLLESRSLDSADISGKLAEYEKVHGTDVYSEFFYLLCHLRFPPAESKEHWQQVVAHQEELEQTSGKAVDFRVALLDYFITVNQKIKNPKIIEIKIFQKTQDCAIRDELTGLHNYRFFRAELERELERAERDGSSVSLAFFDVDYFKWYNDHNGHLAGDHALQRVARILRREVRKTDLAARYGGEEFAILMPGASKRQALAIADRIRATIAAEEFPYGTGQPLGKVTVSGGVATYRIDATDPDGLLEEADRALYLAKSEGKNQIATVVDENREFPRLAIQLRGSLRALSEREEAFVTHDLSEHGFQFDPGRRIEVGEFFRFQFELNGNERIEGVARALRCHKTSSGFEVGARFVELSNDQSRTLKGFLDRTKESAASPP